MTNYELVTLCGGIMKALHENGIAVDDYKWLELYDGYLRMKSQGYKMTYIVAELSKEHNICERKVYKLIGKLGKACAIGAVE